MVNSPLKGKKQKNSSVLTKMNRQKNRASVQVHNNFYKWSTNQVGKKFSCKLLPPKPCLTSAPLIIGLQTKMNEKATVLAFLKFLTTIFWGLLPFLYSSYYAFTFGCLVSIFYQPITLTSSVILQQLIVDTLGRWSYNQKLPHTQRTDPIRHVFPQVSVLGIYVTGPRKQDYCIRYAL